MHYILEDHDLIEILNLLDQPRRSTHLKNLDSDDLDVHEYNINVVIGILNDLQQIHY